MPLQIDNACGAASAMEHSFTVVIRNRCHFTLTGARGVLTPPQAPSLTAMGEVLAMGNQPLCGRRAVRRRKLS